MWRDQINSKEITVRCWKVLKNYNEKINSRILSRIRNTDMLDYIMRFHQNGNSITVAFLVTFLISPKHLSTKDFVCKKFERDFTQKNWLQNHHWSFFHFNPFHATGHFLYPWKYWKKLVTRHSARVLSVHF